MTSTNYKYKNLLFYSNRDPGSLAFMQELSRNPLLDQQFVKICVNDPRIRVPHRILQYNKIPVIVCPGFDKPILGEDAISWLRNNNFSEKSNGVHDFGNIDHPSKLSSEYSMLLEEFRPTEYNQFHNDEYNLGFDKGQNAINSQFSNTLNAQTASMQDPTRINTFEDNENKRGSAGVINRRFEMLQQQRTQEFGGPRRMGGLDPNNQQNGYGNNGNNANNPHPGLNQQQSGQPMGAAFGSLGSDLNQAHQTIIGTGQPNQGSGGSGGRSAPTYNPNVPLGNPQQQQQQRPMQMPNMPNMPNMQMPRMMPNMQMPPQMQQMQQMPQRMPNMQMPPQMHQMQGQMPGQNQMLPPGGPPPPISKEDLRSGPNGGGMQQQQMQRMQQLQQHPSQMQQQPMQMPGMPMMPNMPNQMPASVPIVNIPQQQMRMPQMQQMQQMQPQMPNQGQMPLPNMATNMHRMQAPQMSMQPGYNSSRGSVNPRTYGQPNNPTNQFGPMQGANHMSMTSPHQGLPEPSAANMSNAFHI